MLIAIVVTIPRKWKQSKHLSTECEIKMKHIYTKEHYPAVREKNEIMMFANKWVEIEYIILSVAIQTQKDKSPPFSVTKDSFQM